MKWEERKEARYLHVAGYLTTTLARYLCVDRSAMMREFKNLSGEGVFVPGREEYTDFVVKR